MQEPSVNTSPTCPGPVSRNLAVVFEGDCPAVTQGATSSTSTIAVRAWSRGGTGLDARTV